MRLANDDEEEDEEDMDDEHVSTTCASTPCCWSSSNMRSGNKSRYPVFHGNCNTCANKCTVDRTGSKCGGYGPWQWLSFAMCLPMAANNVPTENVSVRIPNRTRRWWCGVWLLWRSRGGGGSVVVSTTAASIGGGWWSSASRSSPPLLLLLLRESTVLLLVVIIIGMEDLCGTHCGGCGSNGRRSSSGGTIHAAAIATVVVP